MVAETARRTARMKKSHTALDRVEELLDYRLPQSGKQLSTIVLSRAEAEELMREFYVLLQKVDKSSEQ